jgi:dipeptidyl aminopeptidase/acylaminoacyl peptidase
MQNLAYGSWPSPIDAALAAAHDGHPEFVGFVGDEAWWTEPRPAEGGRRTLVRRRVDGTEEPVLPAPWNVRSRVIEYGGQPWAGEMRPEGPFVVFVNFADQRLYAYEPDAPDARPRPLTPVSPVGGGLRWVDPRLRPELGEVWCVLEEFTGEGPTDVRRVVAAVPLDGSAAQDRDAVRELTDGSHRFVTGPRLSPDGAQAAWLAWDHPRMPWDGTELILADVTEHGILRGARSVAGGPEESIAQADWTSDGTLLYASDRTGWWNLYRLGEDTPVCPREEEFGGPLWKIGYRWFAPLESGLVAVVHGRGATALGILDPETGEVVDAAGPWTEFTPTLDAHGSRIVGVAASPRSAYEVVELDARTGRARVIGADHADPVDPAHYPEPQIRAFTGPAGREVHAHIYPPHHPDHVAPGDEWGIVDVEDCAAVALALAEEGTADRQRLAIRGGSAGGWTTAASLTSTDVYACGTILYPVLDLGEWGSGETHDFESQYLETLIGPLAEVPGRYVERSPSERADRITAPFLLLQGLDDVICPPAQCERFLARLARSTGRRVPHAYLTFEGEGHGFRRADTMVRALEAELSLYAQVFGLHPPGVPTLHLTAPEEPVTAPTGSAPPIVESTQ